MQGFRPVPLRCLLGAALLAAVLTGCDDPTSATPPPARSGTVPTVAQEVPKLDALTPMCIGKLDTRLIRECSGFAASRRRPGVFWTFSDSGDIARIIAIREDGTTVKPSSASNYAGIKVTGAENHDWEAAAIDGSGRLILGDFGNNSSGRKKLCLYVVDEPDPAGDLATAKARRVPFHYCDQPVIPDPKKNHDAEAMIAWRGGVYVLTKHWSDLESDLHRIDMTATEAESKPTTHIARFRSGGMVTDAAVSPSGKRVAVLMYTGLWVFEPGESAPHPLSGRVFYRPLTFALTSWQAEAIAFADESTLLIGNEEGDLYRVGFEELSPIPAGPAG